MKGTTRQAVKTYTSTRGDMSMKDITNKTKLSIRCTNVFKNQSSIGTSLTNIWAEVINILENTASMAHNGVVQGSTHQEKAEVSK